MTNSIRRWGQDLSCTSTEALAMKWPIYPSKPVWHVQHMRFVTAFRLYFICIWKIPQLYGDSSWVGVWRSESKIDVIQIFQYKTQVRIPDKEGYFVIACVTVIASFIVGWSEVSCSCCRTLTANSATPHWWMSRSPLNSDHYILFMVATVYSAESLKQGMT